MSFVGLTAALLHFNCPTHSFTIVTIVLRTHCPHKHLCYAPIVLRTHCFIVPLSYVGLTADFHDSLLLYAPRFHSNTATHCATHCYAPIVHCYTIPNCLVPSPIVLRRPNGRFHCLAHIVTITTIVLRTVFHPPLFYHCSIVCRYAVLTPIVSRSRFHSNHCATHCDVINPLSDVLTHCSHGYNSSSACSSANRGSKPPTILLLRLIRNGCNIYY